MPTDTECGSKIIWTWALKTEITSSFHRPTTNWN